MLIVAPELLVNVMLNVPGGVIVQPFTEGAKSVPMRMVRDETKFGSIGMTRAAHMNGSF
jgi:hypothetical protein